MFSWLNGPNKTSETMKYKILLAGDTRVDSLLPPNRAIEEQYEVFKLTKEEVFEVKIHEVMEMIEVWVKDFYSKNDSKTPLIVIVLSLHWDISMVKKEKNGQKRLALREMNSQYLTDLATMMVEFSDKIINAYSAISILWTTPAVPNIKVVNKFFNTQVGIPISSDSSSYQYKDVQEIDCWTVRMYYSCMKIFEKHLKDALKEKNTIWFYKLREQLHQKNNYGLDYYNLGSIPQFKNQNYFADGFHYSLHGKSFFWPIITSILSDVKKHLLEKIGTSTDKNMEETETTTTRSSEESMPIWEEVFNTYKKKQPTNPTVTAVPKDSTPKQDEPVPVPVTSMSLPVMSVPPPSLMSVPPPNFINNCYPTSNSNFSNTSFQYPHDFPNNSTNAYQSNAANVYSTNYECKHSREHSSRRKRSHSKERSRRRRSYSKERSRSCSSRRKRHSRSKSRSRSPSKKPKKHKSHKKKTKKSSSEKKKNDNDKSLTNVPFGQLKEYFTNTELSSEKDAELGFDVASSLIKSLRVFYYKVDNAKMSNAFMETELKLMMVKTIKDGLGDDGSFQDFCRLLTKK